MAQFVMCNVSSVNVGHPDNEGEKNIHGLKVLIGTWRVLEVPDLDLVH